MQRFVIVSLALIMMLPSQGLTQVNCAKCDQALHDADDVINHQEKMLQLVGAQDKSLKDENEKLSEALVKFKNMTDKENGQELTWGAGGVLLGVIAGLLIRGMK